MVEIPVVVDPNDEEWILRLDDQEPKPVLQQVTVVDLLSRAYTIHDEDNKPVGVSPFIKFKITEAGIYFSFETEPSLKAPFGEYESELYDRYAKLARYHGSIGELAILADVV